MTAASGAFSRAARPGAASGHCRVTIVAPTSRVDVALPEDVPLAELLPELLRLVGDPVPPPAAGAAALNGYVLTGIDGTALDTSAALAEQGVVHGGVLRLRPADDLPEAAVHDDIADAVAEAVLAGGTQWSTTALRATALTVVGIAAGLGAVVLWFSGTGTFHGWKGVIAAVITLLLFSLAVWRARYDLGAVGRGSYYGYGDTVGPDAAPRGARRGYGGFGRPGARSVAAARLDPATRGSISARYGDGPAASHYSPDVDPHYGRGYGDHRTDTDHPGSVYSRDYPGSDYDLEFGHGLDDTPGYGRDPRDSGEFLKPLYESPYSSVDRGGYGRDPRDPVDFFESPGQGSYDALGRGLYGGDRRDSVDYSDAPYSSADQGGYGRDPHDFGIDAEPHRGFGQHGYGGDPRYPGSDFGFGRDPRDLGVETGPSRWPGSDRGDGRDPRGVSSDSGLGHDPRDLGPGPSRWSGSERGYGRDPRDPRFGPDPRPTFSTDTGYRQEHRAPGFHHTFRRPHFRRARPPYPPGPDFAAPAATFDLSSFGADPAPGARASAPRTVAAHATANVRSGGLGGLAAWPTVAEAMAWATGAHQQRDYTAAAVLAACSLPYAFIAGVGILPAAGHGLSRVHFTAGAVAVLIVALAAIVGLGRRVAVPVAGATVGLIATLAGIGLQLTKASPAAGIAVVAAGCALAVELLPFAAMAAARFVIEPPTSGVEPGDFEGSPVNNYAVGLRVARTLDTLTGLTAGVGTLLVLCVALLVVPIGAMQTDPEGAHTAWEQALALLVSGVMLCRTRLFRERAQVLAVAVSGLTGLVVAFAAMAANAEPEVRALWLAPLLVVVALLALGLASIRPRRGTSEPILPPRWSRIVDLVEGAVFLAILPVLMAVLGVYGQVRNLKG